MRNKFIKSQAMALLSYLFLLWGYMYVYHIYYMCEYTCWILFSSYCNCCTGTKTGQDAKAAHPEPQAALIN